MANKRFIKPTKSEPIIEQPITYENQNKIFMEEYRYCLKEAKKLHSDWTLKQRQEYASRSANCMFE